MRVIGVTGGVGSGKSAVLDYLEEKYNARIVKADEVSHELMEKGNKVYDRLVELIGDSILDKEGNIDKRALAAVIFSSRGKRVAVNGIVHPLVADRIIDMINKENLAGERKYFIVEAALLLEAHYDHFCDEVWYVRADDEVRVKRLKDNRGYSCEKTKSIMDSQLKDEEFREKCDFTLDNSGTKEALFEKIDARMREMNV